MGPISEIPFRSRVCGFSAERFHAWLPHWFLSQPLRTHEGNLKSVSVNVEMVDRYIAKEVADGKLHLVEDPARGADSPHQPIRIIPKPH